MHKSLRLASLFAALLLSSAATLIAQDATIVYRLGRDTVAVEHFSRTATHFSGETVTRTGPAVVRTQYDITLSGGKPTAAVVRRRRADGSPIPNNPTEVRFTFAADTARREIVWSDSTRVQSFAARNAFVALPVF